MSVDRTDLHTSTGSELLAWWLVGLHARRARRASAAADSQRPAAYCSHPRHHQAGGQADAPRPPTPLLLTMLLPCSRCLTLAPPPAPPAPPLPTSSSSICTSGAKRPT